jgi:hypothetical protein
LTNDFSVPEEKFLRTIALEEQFGGKTYQQTKSKDDKKKAEKGKAAIGFVYEDSTPKPEETAGKITFLSGRPSSRKDRVGKIIFLAYFFARSQSCDR